MQDTGFFEKIEVRGITHIFLAIHGLKFFAKFTQKFGVSPTQCKRIKHKRYRKV